MRHTITVIYFKDNAGKAHSLEFSFRSLALAVGGLGILILIVIVSTVFAVKFYVEKGRLTHELASVSLERKMAEAQGGTAAENASATVRLSPTVAPIAAISGQQLSLHNLQIKQENEDNRIDVSFDLVKATGADAAMQGYVFIVADYGGEYFTFPKDRKITDGAPVDFKEGDPFAIRRQKHIQQILPYSLNDKVKAITVFVFAADGTLLTKKVEQL